MSLLYALLNTNVCLVLLTYYLFYAQLLLLFFGVIASFLTRNTLYTLRIAGHCSIIASIFGFFLSFIVLTQDFFFTDTLPFSLPMGTISLSIDPLAAFFLLPLNLIGGLASWLLLDKATAGITTKANFHGFFFCLLLLSLTLVIIASDAFLFLFAWEVMSLCPLFLLSSDKNLAKERFSAWIYIVVTHLGALPLFLLFAFLIAKSGHTTFSDIQSTMLPATGFLFILALIGFGAKSGLFPVHIWMPETYSSAPPHIAILLSGAMVNTGIYGLLRVLSLIGEPVLWWGYALMIVGGVSGLMGIMFTLAQKEIKRALAYSSSENMGIVCLGLGAALVALHHEYAGRPYENVAAQLLSGGALLHIWNHSLFKSSLMLGAEIVQKTTGTTSLNQLGGLAKRMPTIALCMGIGCAAIAGALPLNGFMSELLLFMGFAFGSVDLPGSGTALIFWIGFFTLGTISGLAFFAFTRLYAMVFAGMPRSSAVAENITAPSPRSSAVLLVLTGSCIVAALASPLLYIILAPVQDILGIYVMPAYLHEGPIGILLYAVLAGLGTCVLFAAIFFWMRQTTATRTSLTWDCGYVQPAAKMQYTGASFSYSSIRILAPFLRPKITVPNLRSLFPAPSTARVEVSDWPTRLWKLGPFNLINFLSKKIRIFQHGLLNSYIFYIVIALVVALIWAWGC